MDGVVAIVDEMQNADGVWVRLAPETLAAMTIQHAEGWCLQFNQHLEKTLLVPVEDPKPLPVAEGNHGDTAQRITTAIPQRSLSSSLPNGTAGGASAAPLGIFPPPEPILRQPGRSGRARSASVTRGPGMYTVVKCGASGHNIRSNPNMLAAPIGMLNLGNVVTVVEVKEVPTGGGNGEVWVQLDQESVEKHCFSFDGGDAWSLAVSATDVQYLQSEAEAEENKMVMLQQQQQIPLGADGVAAAAGPLERIFSLASQQQQYENLVLASKANYAPPPMQKVRTRHSEPGHPSSPAGAALAAGEPGNPAAPGGGVIPRRKSDLGGTRHSPVHFDFTGTVFKINQEVFYYRKLWTSLCISRPISTRRFRPTWQANSSPAQEPTARVVPFLFETIPISRNWRIGRRQPEALVLLQAARLSQPRELLQPAHRQEAQSRAAPREQGHSPGAAGRLRQRAGQGDWREQGQRQRRDAARDAAQPEEGQVGIRLQLRGQSRVEPGFGQEHGNGSLVVSANSHGFCSGGQVEN